VQSPAVILNAAFRGRECRVVRREADWEFDFGDRFSIAVSVPWRVVTADGIAHGYDDDGQWFGLPQPVNGEARTNELLQGQKVSSVELDEQTADLRVVFGERIRLDLFNQSSGYEGWQASLPDNGNEISVIALGGGGVAIV
jgi:hypothetical protein